LLELLLLQYILSYIPRSLRSLFKNCWVTFNSFLVSYFSPSFHNYLCFDFSKIVFLPLISNFTWKDQIDFNLCLLPC